MCTMSVSEDRDAQFNGDKGCGSEVGDGDADGMKEPGKDRDFEQVLYTVQRARRLINRRADVYCPRPSTRRESWTQTKKQ